MDTGDARVATFPEPGTRALTAAESHRRALAVEVLHVACARGQVRELITADNVLNLH